MLKINHSAQAGKVKRFTCVLTAVFGLQAFAVQAETFFADLHQLPALLDSRTLEASEPSHQEKIYPLGSISRISGKLRYSEELLLRGERQVLTLRLASTQTADDAFTASREFMQQQDARMLFWCEARDCGSSNLWANEIFDNSRLYGPDQQQRYAVFLQPPNRLLTVYAITRGNGRGMLHVERFIAEDIPTDLRPSPSTLLRQLQHGEKLQLEGLPAEPQEPWLELLSRTLKQGRMHRMVIGGSNAPAWYTQLLESGVNGKRLELDSAPEESLYLQIID